MALLCFLWSGVTFIFAELSCLTMLFKPCKADYFYLYISDPKIDGTNIKQDTENLYSRIQKEIIANDGPRNVLGFCCYGSLLQNSDCPRRVRYF